MPCRRWVFGTSTCRSHGTRCGARFATRKQRRSRVRRKPDRGWITVNLQYTGEEKIPAGPDTVWAFVTDPDKVGHCFPDVVGVTVKDPTHFDAIVKVGVGPVRGKFTMKVELVPASSKRRIDMKI